MKQGKVRTILTWFLQIVLGLEFIIAGQAKFTMQDIWIEKFRNWGLPDNVYLLIGGLEVLGGILILFPRFASKAALGLILVMGGAVVTHSMSQEWTQMIVPVVLLGLLSAVHFLRKK